MIILTILTIRHLQKKPLIGHNISLDLIHTINRFICKLPEVVTSVPPPSVHNITNIALPFSLSLPLFISLSLPISTLYLSFPLTLSLSTSLPPSHSFPLNLSPISLYLHTHQLIHLVSVF